MTDYQHEFIESFRKQLITYAIIALFTVVGTAIGFYYNTQHAISNQRAELERMDKRQGAFELNLQQKINKPDYIREMDEVKALLRTMDSKIDRLK